MQWTVDKKGMLSEQENILCIGCRFVGDDCWKRKIEWLLAEHKEQPTITSNEKKFLEILDFEYITRDKTGALCGHEKKPVKDKCIWLENGKVWSFIYNNDFKNVKFDFVQWEDDEPWAVEDLLKLEVKDENNY